MTLASEGAASGQVAEASTLARAIAGDADAFDTLLRPRLARLVRIARAILRDEADAHDVVQEACVRGWRELPRLRDQAAFDAWLTQIVVNGCRSAIRGRRRVAVREIAADDAHIEDRADRSRSAPLLGDQVVAAEAVRRAFARLGPDDRTLLVLHHVEDRPLGEIAAAMRVPLGTVKWRLSRARHALERALEAER